MKKVALLLPAVIFLMQLKAQHYKGNWETYLMQIDGKPASVVVDLDFGEAAMAKEKRNVILVQVDLQKMQSDGMPVKAEIQVLDSMENKLITGMSDSLDAQYTGRYTLNGRRDFYFYSNDTSGCRGYLTQVFNAFPSYRWSLLVKPDPELSNYLNVLYPSQRELERIRNRRMADVLQDKGDLLTAPRKVQHFIFFKTESTRKDFLRQVQDIGFEIDNAGKEIGVQDLPYSLIISRVDKVDPNNMDKVSLLLWELALRYGAKYDGWETFVVR